MSRARTLMGTSRNVLRQAQHERKWLIYKRPFALSLSKGGVFRGALICAGLFLAGTPALADIDSVYEAAPPPEAGFVRFINLGAQPVQVQLGDASTIRLDADSRRISRYEIVSGQTSVQVSAAGKSARTTLSATPGRYHTYLLSGPQTPLTMQVDDASAFNLLKSRLTFYNLSAQCPQADLVAVTPQPLDVIAGVARNAQAQRSVNPVKAQFRARCHASGQGTTSFTPDANLPELLAGKRYSLVLIDTPRGPRLIGTSDSTATYRR